MNDIGMIAADTSRSRAYLQALARNALLPNFVLLLEHRLDGSLPGQKERNSRVSEKPAVPEMDECWSEAHFDTDRRIKGILDEHDVPYEIFLDQNINDTAVVEAVRARAESVFIYSGFGGVILRKAILGTEKSFLHVHGGFLPDYKGSTTNYFSLIVENTMGASSLFLSQEIDCGPVLLRREFPAPQNREAIDHHYDSGARAKVLVETLQQYVQNGTWEVEIPENSGGETYFIIHPVLKHIAIMGRPSEDK